MWPWPRGKYQTSPGSKSLVSDAPCGSITVVRTRPSSTSAHSAAVACQCSSRIAPGSSFIETPAIPLEIGSWVTVASLPKLLPITLPCDFSSANLKVGSSFSESWGSGTLFMKDGSPAAACCVPLNVASVAMPAAAVKNSRRCGSDMMGSWGGRRRERKPNLHQFGVPATQHRTCVAQCLSSCKWRDAARFLRISAESERYSQGVNGYTFHGLFNQLIVS